MAKKRNRRRILKSTLLGFIFLIICIGLIHKVTLTTYNYAESVIETESARINDPNIIKTTLNITKHSTVNEIADTLYSDGLITDRKYFKIEAGLEYNHKKLVPGEYSFNSSMTVSDMLSLLTSADTSNNQSIRITIPNGSTIENIADSLDSKNIISAEDFLLAATTLNFDSSYPFLQNIPDNSHYKYKLEGYLFPGTYTIRKDASAEEIIILMLDRFEEMLSRYTTYINGSHYSIHELITIASLTERETNLDEERPVVAGVIYNRLNANMNLQLCSSLQYILSKRRSNLSLVDLKKDNVYNTHLYSGLPIGPICNPSEASIKSALFPLNHDYLYFVLDNHSSGSHHFSTTWEEHDFAKHLANQLNDLNFVS